MGDLKKVFRPEFLNRIDEVIVFHKLAKDEILHIVDLMISRVRTPGGRARPASWSSTSPPRSCSSKKGWDPAMGARPAAPRDPAVHRGPARRRGAEERRDPFRLYRDDRARQEGRRGRQAPQAEDRQAAQEGPAPEEEGPPPRRWASAPTATTATTTDDGEGGFRRVAFGLLKQPGRTAIGSWSGGPLPPLRRGDLRGAARGAAAPRQSRGGGRSTHRAHGGHLRPGGSRFPRRALHRRGGPRFVQPGRRGSATTSMRASATAPRGFPPVHGPGAARGRSVRVVSEERGREEPRSPGQPSAFDLLLLHNPDRAGYDERSGLGGDGGAARRGPRGRDRRRPRSRQRVHPGPDRLLRAVRLPHRLGDGDPQPPSSPGRQSCASTPRRRTTSA